MTIDVKWSQCGGDGRFTVGRRATAAARLTAQPAYLLDESLRYVQYHYKSTHGTYVSLATLFTTAPLLLE